jgi:ATP-dependent RNA helicase DDX52/ROK1
MAEPFAELAAGTSLRKADRKALHNARGQGVSIEAQLPEAHLPRADRAGRARRLNAIAVEGSSPPSPAESFAHCLPEPLPERLFRKLAIANASAIQMQATPVVLDRSLDAAIIAPTGSGKTAAFAAPIAADAASQPSAFAIQHVVLSPTRELCRQTEHVLAALVDGDVRRVHPSRSTKKRKVKSESNEGTSAALLAAGRVMVGTPRAAAQALQRFGGHALERLVLDEADRLLQAGFYENVAQVVAGLPESAQRVVLSAAMPESTEALARQEILRGSARVVRVSVGERTTPCENVKQELRFVSQETAKPLALRQLVHEGLAVPCLVFTSTRKRAQTAAEEIAASSSRFTGRVALVHAGVGEGDRRRALSRFREGAAWILVATDLVARGMDFVGLATVINVDLPQSRAEYVHRVGRAGRAGQRGHAVSLFTEDDWRDLRPIAEAVRSSGSDVADWMLKMPKVDKRKPRSERSSMVQTPERSSAHGGKETTKSNTTVSEQLRKSPKKSYEP